MKNFFYVFSDNESLKQFLNSPEVNASAANTKSVLFQIFSSQTENKVIDGIADIIISVFPTAVITGATTVGEILEGLLYTSTIVLSISFFETSIVKSIGLSVDSGNELNTGEDLIRAIHAAGPDIAGVLLLSTPLTVNIAEIFKGMSKEELSFPIFGGGTGVYDSVEHSIVFCGNNFYNRGIVAVVFLGRDLHIYAKTFLGWQSLSKEMTITEIDGMLLKKVDDVNAFDIYKRYLNLQNDKDFFKNVLEFPLLLERDGEMIVRVPFCVYENGYIEFIADLKPGEKFHIGYEDPDIVIRNSKAIQDDLYDFSPNVIFLFSNICRRFSSQADIVLETQPYNLIAPTAGLYTYGEFCSVKNKILLQNSAIVVVGMREGEKRPIQKSSVADETLNAKASEQYTNKHSGIIYKLLHFIKTVSSELERSNRDLVKISGIDKTTQVYNRYKLDSLLQYEMNRSVRYHTNFSVIILEPDICEKYNDDSALCRGNDVLAPLAKILKNNIRRTDAVGKWEDEKFLVILPETNPEQACIVAEKIRHIISSSEFFSAEQISCSFGVSSFFEGDDLEKIMLRAEKSLCKAKSSGENKIVYTDPTMSKTI